jgi:hypothetical protein
MTNPFLPFFFPIGRVVTPLRILTNDYRVEILISEIMEEADPSQHGEDDIMSELSLRYWEEFKIPLIVINLGSSVYRVEKGRVQ